MTNPLLADWETPFGLPPFAQISDDHFAEAFDVALDEARAATLAIATQDAAPTFANTIEAMETADARLGRVLAAFFALVGTDANDRREALMREVSPRLAAYGSEVRMNPDLFARIEALWQARETLGLTSVQDRLLYLTRRGFVRAGAQLDASPLSAAELREGVTSPNGTTAAGLAVLMPELPDLVRRTVGAAAERARALGREAGQ